MLVLFIRAIILYALVFFVIRLMGKRQLSDLQPFDLVITLLIADLASAPVSNTTIPLAYSVVPIIALFLMHKTLAFLSLKLPKVRSMVCGMPLVMIERGVVKEKLMRTASYTISDLLEQLRKKDVFNISDVEYAILETNGELSVLLKGAHLTPTYETMGITPPQSHPANTLVLDGKPIPEELQRANLDYQHLMKHLESVGFSDVTGLLLAILNHDGILHIQTNAKNGGKVLFIDTKTKRSKTA